METVKDTTKKRLKIGARSFSLPGSRLARMIIGAALLVGGVLGALPILGFWMVPLGLLVLSVDVPAVRRWRRRVEVRFGRWRRRRDVVAS